MHPWKVQEQSQQATLKGSVVNTVVQDSPEMLCSCLNRIQASPIQSGVSMDREHPTGQNGIWGIWKPSGLLELFVLFLGPLVSSF